ncbi:hypothetical protein Tco_1476743 [Tanacetum coccineum]
MHITTSPSSIYIIHHHKPPWHPSNPLLLNLPKINIIPPKQLFVDLTQGDTKTPSPKHQLSSPSAPNAPSKTPSTKGTSSSSIDYTPKSPTSSTSPSKKWLLELTNIPSSMRCIVAIPSETQASGLGFICLIKHFAHSYGEELRLSKLKIFIIWISLRLQLRVNLMGLMQRTCPSKTQKHSSRNFLPQTGQEDKVNMREAVDAGLVVTESSGTKPDKQDTSSSSGNYTTQAVDADIGPVNGTRAICEIGIGQRFSLNKSSAVHEKPHTPISRLRWKLAGRIFKTVSLRWIPTGKMFTDSTTKVDSEPPNGTFVNPLKERLRFKPRSSSNDVWTKQFKPRSSSILMTLDHSSSSLGAHCLMMSVHISSGLVLHLDDV